MTARETARARVAERQLPLKAWQAAADALVTPPSEPTPVDFRWNWPVFRDAQIILTAAWPQIITGVTELAIDHAARALADSQEEGVPLDRRPYSAFYKQARAALEAADAAIPKDHAARLRETR